MNIISPQRSFFIMVCSFCVLMVLVNTPVLVYSGETSSPGSSVMEQEAMHYPVGRMLRKRSQYKKFNQRIAIQPEEFLEGVRIMSAEGASSGASVLIQDQLPEGLTLMTGLSSRLTMAFSAAEEVASRQQGEMGKSFIIYPVAYKGIPLAKGSDVFALVRGDGQVLVVRERNLTTTINTTDPTIGSQKAIDLALSHMKKKFPQLQSITSNPVLVVWVDPLNQQGHLAWELTVRSDADGPPLGRRYWVAATEHSHVLQWETLIYKEHRGMVTGSVWQASPRQAPGNIPLGALAVRRSGGVGGSTTTGKDGTYSLPGNGPVEIRSTLEGPFVRVQNMAGPGMTRSQAGNHQSSIDLNFDATSEVEFAQVSAFYWTNVAREFAKSILGPGELVNLPTSVNRSDDVCNAFWTGSSMLFYREGVDEDGITCPNTAYPDVILHEFGHGIDDFKGGILDGGLSEGTGDAISILVTRQSCAGRDFFGPGTCLRPATDTDMWPPSPGERVHKIGKRYAQFTWQLIQELQGTSGISEDDAYRIATQLTLGSIASNPSDIPDAVHLTFLADDNDGDLSNGTRHCRQIVAAAASRSLPLPQFLQCTNEPEVEAAEFRYSAKIVCGIQENIKDLRLARGSYATAINIHNPETTRTEFHKSLALTFPPEEQRPGRVFPIAKDSLNSDEALAVDCADIRRKLFPNGFPTPYIKGFVIIQSEKSLDVSAVYTTSGLKEGEDENGGTRNSVDIEQVQERRIILYNIPK